MNNSEETVRYTVCELFDQLKDALNEKKHIEEMNQRYIGKMQEQQDQIAELKKSLNRMEQCYIGMKKERDELEQSLKHLSEMNNKSISCEHDLFDKGWNQCAKQTVENIYKLTGIGVQEDLGGNSNESN